MPFYRCESFMAVQLKLQVADIEVQSVSVCETFLFCYLAVDEQFRCLGVFGFVPGCLGRV
jgi:hypothetical protein